MSDHKKGNNKGHQSMVNQQKNSSENANDTPLTEYTPLTEKNYVELAEVSIEAVKEAARKQKKMWSQRVRFEICWH